MERKRREGRIANLLSPSVIQWILGCVSFKAGTSLATRVNAYTPSGRVLVVVLHTKRISRKCALYTQHCSALSTALHGIRNEVEWWKMESGPRAPAKQLLRRSAEYNSLLFYVNFVNFCGSSSREREKNYCSSAYTKDDVSIRLNCGC